jgi:hypothetical protein
VFVIGARVVATLLAVVAIEVTELIGPKVKLPPPVACDVAVVEGVFRDENINGAFGTAVEEGPVSDENMRDGQQTFASCPSSPQIVFFK